MGGHGHDHAGPEAGDRRVLAAVAINLGLTVAQIVGGIVAGGLALIADAVHNLSDALSLVIAFVARRIARRPANPDMTFGYARAESVAALVNYTTLIVIGLYLAGEGVRRLIEPQPVDGWLVVIVAAAALAVDAATAALTSAMSKASQNIRAAFLHNLADALGSLAVIVAGGLILLYDWRLADPIATLLIAGYILWMAFAEIGDVIRLLMLGAPAELDAEEVAGAVEALDGVEQVHHVRLWRMEERRPALDAHLQIEAGRWAEADAIKQAAREMLAGRFEIDHTTLEMECSRHGCDGPARFGHDGRRA